MNRLSIAAAVLALSAAQAHATIIAADLFDDASYSLGANIYPNGGTDIGYGNGYGPNDGSGFTSGWENGNDTSPRVAVAGLSYTGLATSGFGAASPAYIPATYSYNSTALRTFSNNTATSDLWMSFLIQSNGISTQNFSTYPNYGGIQIVGATGSVFVGVPGVQPTGTADYSLQNADVVSSTKAAASGQTDLLVVDISSNGNAYLYVDPTLGSPLGAPDATLATTLTPSGAGGLYWTDSWGWTYGDIRVGTSFADVSPAPAPSVPEPASWVVMLVGFACLGGALRMRRGGLRAAI